MLGKTMLIAAVVGVILNYFHGPKPADPVGSAFIFAGIVLMFWYPIKAILITSGTIVRFRKEGKPLFEAGGLTEYDREFAKQVGEAAAKASKKVDEP